MKCRKLFIFFLFVLPVTVIAQFAPAAGQTGTTAIYKDSLAFAGWAVSCKVIRGFINIEDTTETYTQGDSTSNRAFFGTAENAVGKPGGVLDVISLGDGGAAVLTFGHPITNGPGPDFAVFENGFQAQSAPFHYYLELAFVEVSTDGKRFVRFPAVSLMQDSVQIDGFGQLDPTKIHNLAGKYQVDYGTPFDLNDIADSTGIDIDSINFVRVVDVVGDIDSAYACYDSKGNIINDPWPSPYWTGGFDLDAVGVIHEKSLPAGVNLWQNISVGFRIYPNPADGHVLIENISAGSEIFRFSVYSLGGKMMTDERTAVKAFCLNTSGWPKGMYLLKIQSGNQIYVRKLLISH